MVDADNPAIAARYTVNIYYWQSLDEYPFNFLISIIAGTIWVKAILQMQNTQTIGPMIKIL